MPGLLDFVRGQQEMRATPRNGLLGAMADYAAAANQFASKPFGYANPPGEILSGLLGVPAIAKTLDRLSYGEPITNINTANVPLLKPETADAAMTIAPVAVWGGKRVAGLLSDPRLAEAVASMASPKYVSPAARGRAGARGQGGMINLSFEKTDDLSRSGDIALRDGGLVMQTPGFGRSSGELRQKAQHWALDNVLPKYDHFFRFTNNRKEIDLARTGLLRPSINHADKMQERGLSVANGPHYSIYGYKHVYPVRGNVVGRGSDGEPLLDPATIEVLSRGMQSPAAVVARDRAKRAQLLESLGLQPDFFEGGVRFMNDPFTFTPIP